MMMNGSYTAVVKNVLIVVTAALAASSLSVVDATSSYKCTFEDSASLHGSRRFTIRTRHRNRIMKGRTFHFHGQMNVNKCMSVCTGIG